MMHTAVYFSPELDTVHVVDGFGSEFVFLAQRTNKETIRSIRALAFGSPLLQDVLKCHTATSLLAFESLETLILVVEGEEEELIREQAEDYLVKVQKDRLVLQEKCKVWKLPAVRVMSVQAIENHL
jgi:hypothetical protein